MQTHLHTNAPRLLFSSPVLSVPLSLSNTHTHRLKDISMIFSNTPPRPYMPSVSSSPRLISYKPINIHPSAAAAAHLLQSVDFERDLSPVARGSEKRCESVASENHLFCLVRLHRVPKCDPLGSADSFQRAITAEVIDVLMWRWYEGVQPFLWTFTELLLPFFIPPSEF